MTSALRYNRYMANKSIYVAGGCFWGLEEFMSVIPGVVSTEVGYAGGKNHNPTWDFHPGHAETVKLDFDPSLTNEKEILNVFFRVHDPTTMNRQGYDVGTSYRSAIFYASDEEKSMYEKLIDEERSTGFWKDEITTTVEPLGIYGRAEEYHQKYFQKHPGGYTCHFLRV